MLSKNSEVLSYKDDCIYYTDDSGDSLSLYDYVEGTDVIDTLKEPVEEDYQITQDKYEMLDEYSTLEDYEAIYTSCTKVIHVHTRWRKSGGSAGSGISGICKKI